MGHSKKKTRNGSLFSGCAPRVFFRFRCAPLHLTSPRCEPTPCLPAFLFKHRITLNLKINHATHILIPCRCWGCDKYFLNSTLQKDSTERTSEWITNKSFEKKGKKAGKSQHLLIGDCHAFGKPWLNISCHGSIFHLTDAAIHFTDCIVADLHQLQKSLEKSNRDFPQPAVRPLNQLMLSCALNGTRCSMWGYTTCNFMNSTQACEHTLVWWEGRCSLRVHFSKLDEKMWFGEHLEENSFKTKPYWTCGYLSSCFSVIGESSINSWFLWVLQPNQLWTHPFSPPPSHDQSCPPFHPKGCTTFPCTKLCLIAFLTCLEFWNWLLITYGSQCILKNWFTELIP